MACAFITVCCMREDYNRLRMFVTMEDNPRSGWYLNNSVGGWRQTTDPHGDMIVRKLFGSDRLYLDIRWSYNGQLWQVVTFPRQPNISPEKMFGPPKTYLKHLYLGCIGIVPGYLFFARKHPLLVGGNSNMFYFHPYLGKIPILTNIFRRGWNHQPVFLIAHRQNHPCIQQAAQPQMLECAGLVEANRGWSSRTWWHTHRIHVPPQSLTARPWKVSFPIGK